MVPRRQRLKRSDFSTGYPQLRASSDHFSLTQKAGDSSRFAIIVSKKVLASAVKRNELRRRASAVLLSLNLPAATYMVYAKKGAGALSYTELVEELTRLLKSSASV